MITRKTEAVVSSIVWPYTPEPSPRLAPVAPSGKIEDDFIMSTDELRPARPISLAVPRDHTSALSPGGRPTLDDVLNNRAPQPYTLSAFMAYLSQQHCLETLAFTLDAKKYREKYDTASAHLMGMSLNYESDEGDELQQEWTRILNIYIRPGAPSEINLPSEERNDLLHWPYSVKPPPPEALEPSVKRMHDLMSDSIFIPFCNSLRPASYAQTYAAFSDFGGRESQLDPSRSTLDERRNVQQRAPPRRRHSPPATSNTFDLPSRASQPSHRHTQSSTLSSALNRATSNRLPTNASNSPSASGPEYALTDDSGSVDSPGPAEPRTPPTTPPTSDVTPKVSGQTLAHSPPKSNRSDSGSWKKMGYKLGWGKKKSAGALRETSDES
jgi:Regulator of G protein signaling domain